MPKAKSHRPTPSITIIGPGRLGQAFALGLAGLGYSIHALVARRAAAAEKAARLLSAGPLQIQALGLNQLAALAPTDLVLITTPDDAVEDVAHRLLAVKSGKGHGSVVLHTSGALSSEVLAPLAEIGFHTGSLHPLVSVSDPRTGAKALHGAYYCVEGDKAATKLARRIVKDLNGHSFSVQPAKKALYHAAALTAAGHLTALVDVAIEMLASSGLSPSEAQRVLMPLVESAVSNLKVSTPAQALTGTFARGDVATVKRHLAALSRGKTTETLEIYKLLGVRSLQLAGKRGLDPQLAKKIRELLDSQH
ncbi:MAG TPA: Rossmann-like and DUF2520 domain-containing protein [Pyrinomonadaceae bacterium]|nr:Rossmann-like and DUF2520 domain-containing protein [Pyrinomonadaceae bacterium]